MKSLISKTSIALLLFFLSGILKAQQSVSQNDLMEKIIENIAEENEENTDFSSLLDELNQLILNPINLNTASENELNQIFFLTQHQIDELIAYRKNNGNILSLYEMQLIPGFSRELVRTIAPLIHLQPDVQAHEKKGRPQQMLLLRTERNLEKERAYTSDDANAKYLGNPWKYYTRYQFQSLHSGIDFGLTAEKDKGEPFFENKNKNGFDFYSVHFQKKANGFLQQINLGDYQVKFGQGLCLWTGMSTGKSSFTTQNAKRHQGIRAYKSTDENLFFRGISILLQPIKNMKLAVFASSKNIDASLIHDSTHYMATSIVNTGLHRNYNEMQKKDALSEKTFGSYLTFNTRNLTTGISFIRYEFSPEIQKKEQAYSQFNFSGKDNYNISFSYQTNLNKIYFYGEAARSKSGGMGILQAANIEVHPQLNLELLYRKFDKNYQAHYSNAFSEQSRNQNEEGFYIGLDFHPLPKWSLKAYYDQYEFPWLRYSSNAPSEGHEYFSQLEYTPNEKISVYMRYKQENKLENSPSEMIISASEIKKTQLRFHVSAQLSAQWEIRNRIEFSGYEQDTQNEKGFLLYQDLLYRFPSLPLRFSMRYAIFDTDSYDTRIYAYESNILYAYSIPAYYSKGSRFYLNLTYKIGKRMNLYARYAQTRYSKAEHIGSGNSQIDGNRKSEVKFQLRFRF